MKSYVLMKNDKIVQFVGSKDDCIRIKNFLLECEKTFRNKNTFKIVKPNHQQFYEDLLAESKIFE